MIKNQKNLPSFNTYHFSNIRSHLLCHFRIQTGVEKDKHVDGTHAL